MKFGYIDSSIFVALLLREPQAEKYQSLLGRKEELLSSYLLEAELYSAATRERVSLEQVDDLLRGISLIIPDRFLTEEYRLIFSKGYCRGADAHHIACALYLDPTKKELEFITADHRQGQMARTVGLKAP